ncbi:hypothetical protein [Bacillus massiliigorillae]|uniref:hypothetical protein n=1 Tax=Bacillus massiliigorillae TaxID=1243664 RepID=UPI0003AA8165|nr:hypothetical protein [Bacillus massiliigorillae]
METIILFLLATGILVAFLFVFQLELSNVWKLIVSGISLLFSVFSIYGMYYMNLWIIAIIVICLLAVVSFILVQQWEKSIYSSNDVIEKSYINKSIESFKSEEENYIENRDYIESFSDTNNFETPNTHSTVFASASQDSSFKNDFIHLSDDAVQSDTSQDDLDQFVLKEERKREKEVEEQVVSPLEELLSEQSKQEENTFAEIEPIVFSEDSHEKNLQNK